MQKRYATIIRYGCLGTRYDVSKEEMLSLTSVFDMRCDTKSDIRLAVARHSLSRRSGVIELTPMALASEGAVRKLLLKAVVLDLKHRF